MIAREGRPLFQSFAARAGVLAFVVLSGALGFIYWSEEGDWPLACATVGAEIIAFVGLGIAHHNWRADRKLAVGAVFLTILAAAWCGFTTWQKIEHDTRARALEEARERPAYVFAHAAMQSASVALQERLAASPPGCACPDTLRAWEATQAASATRLERERDQARQRLEAATPPAQTDWIAIGRGAGMELIKLLGFLVFGLATTQRPAPGDERPQNQPFSVVAGGRAAEPPAPPKRRGIVGRTIGGAALAIGLAQQNVAHVAPMNTTEQAISEPVRSLSPAQMAEIAHSVVDALGERGVAAHLSQISGRTVTRYQVRVMLGRLQGPRELRAA